MLQNRRGIAFSAARANPGGQSSSETSMLELEFAELTDPGKVRSQNEDYIGHSRPASQAELRSHGWLFALADGVGGHDRGEVASSTAIHTLLSCFRNARADEPPTGLLQQFVQTANLKIYETGAGATPDGSSMCTTIVCCILRFDRVTIAHVGDSRCYLVRRGRAAVLTNDHSVVAEQVRMGLLSAEEAAQSERRHVLSRSLGANMFVNPEINEHQLLPGDLLLLSSDGLHGSVTAGEIAAITSQFPDLKEAAHHLISLAREKDGSDNISAQLIRIKSVERIGMYRGRPYKLR
jgi:protein phosphatase